MSLSDRLKRVRESLGYTQKEMAKAISTNPQTWQVYEAGKSVPGGNVLEALARMGFNVNWILTGEGEMKQGCTEVKSSARSGKVGLQLPTIIKAIEECALKYDLFISSHKQFTLTSALYDIFGEALYAKEDISFDKILNEMIRLCIPDSEDTDINYVKSLLTQAKEALKLGNIVEMRKLCCIANKQLKYVLGSSYAVARMSEIKRAQKLCYSLVENDTLYKEGIESLLPIIQTKTREKSLLLETMLYNSVSGLTNDDVSYILTFAQEFGVLEKKPYGGTHTICLLKNKTEPE